MNPIRGAVPTIASLAALAPPRAALRPPIRAASSSVLVHHHGHRRAIVRPLGVLRPSLQTLPIATLVKHPPPPRTLHHGTSGDRAAMIARFGFDLSMTGTNYGFARAGDGVYTSLTRADAEKWGLMWQFPFELPDWLPRWLSRLLRSGVTVIEIYPPDDNPLY